MVRVTEAGIFVPDTISIICCLRSLFVEVNLVLEIAMMQRDSLTSFRRHGSRLARHKTELLCTLVLSISQFELICCLFRTSIRCTRYVVCLFRYVLPTRQHQTGLSWKFTTRSFQFSVSFKNNI